MLVWANEQIMYSGKKGLLNPVYYISFGYTIAKKLIVVHIYV